MGDPTCVNDIDPSGDAELYNGAQVLNGGLPRMMFGYTNKQRLVWCAIYVACHDFLPKSQFAPKSNYLQMLLRMIVWKENDVELFKKLKAGLEQHSNQLELIDTIEDKNQKAGEQQDVMDWFIYDNINLHEYEH